MSFPVRMYLLQEKPYVISDLFGFDSFRSIADSDGPKVTDIFYEYLFQRHPALNSTTVMADSRPDTTQAARALHIAVGKLRSEGASFMRWVPLIHLGT